MYFKELFYSVLLILSTFSTLYFTSNAYADVPWKFTGATARTDGTPLPLDEIKNYTAYITGTVVDDEIVLPVPAVDTSFVFTGRDYGCAKMTTVDTDGRESGFSNTSCKGTFPEYLVELMGDVPEEKTIVINVAKPANTTEAVLLMSAYDADMLGEGELIINGNTPISLFDTNGPDSEFSDVIITTPGAFWNDDDNTLRFTHTATGGYVINSIEVNFGVTVLSPPHPPVLQ
jgi:hypothetical protein